MERFKTGLVQGLSHADYLAVDALSASGLRRLRQSPAHYRFADDNEATPAMIAGTLAHCVLLEPGALDDRYAVRPDGLDGRTRDGKAWLATVREGVTVIDQEQADTAFNQALSIRKLPEVSELLSRGAGEVSAFWLDDETGIRCKCRPDWVSPAGDGVILFDLKTCPDASGRGFQRKVAQMAYHLQAAWYCDGYAKATGTPVLGFVFGAVEGAKPWAAAAYMLDDESMAKAREEVRTLVRLYSICKTHDLWPAYPTSIQPLSLPAWA